VWYSLFCTSFLCLQWSVQPPAKAVVSNLSN
jgi:hypothetical protein